MITGSADQRAPHTRLDTWKSIAHYLGRSSRTVQRWHSAYGLPVHHLSGDSGSVYAYSDDLDNWLRSRGRSESGKFLDVAGAKTLTGTTPQSAQDQDRSIFAPLLISEQAKSLSDQLVALADRMWEAVSHRNLTMIVQHYRQAIDLNPGNADAYAGLSIGLIMQGLMGLVSTPVAYASAKAAMEYAALIDPEQQIASSAAAWLDTLSMRQWSGARQGFERVLQSSTSSPHALNGRGLLYIAEGELKQASACFFEASRQRPLSSSSMALYCWSEYLAGEFAYTLHRVDEVRSTGWPSPILDAVDALATIQLADQGARIDYIRSLVTSFPHNDVARGALGYFYAVDGQQHRARELLDTMTREADRRIGRDPYAIALVLLGLGEKHQAFQCLEQSYRNGSLWSLGFKSDPILMPLRNDNHYRLLFSRLSYPDPENAELRLEAAD